MPCLSSPRAGRRSFLAAPLALAGCATGIGEPLPGPAKARVLLFRGIADISTGLDSFARRLREAGYSASVHSHLAGPQLAERLVALAQQSRLPRPLCLGGHSLGADTAIGVAGRIASAALATDLLVTLDPVLVGTVPRGPRQVINYYQAGNGFGRPLTPQPGFDGTIENVDQSRTPGLGHFNIDGNGQIQREIVARIEALRRSAAPATAR